MARFEIPQGWTAQAYRFALDLSPAQLRALESHCGAARFAFNQMLDVVQKNLDQRSAERSYGLCGEELTPAQGWTLAALRKTWNKLARRLEAGTARVLSATVSYRAGRWWCALQVLIAGKARPAHAGRSPHRVVGVDVGVTDLLVAATPDGVQVDRIPARKPLVAAQAGVRALQRRAARQHGPYDPATATRREPSKRWQRTEAAIAGGTPGSLTSGPTRSIGPPPPWPPSIRWWSSSSWPPRTWPAVVGRASVV